MRISSEHSVDEASFVSAIGIKPMVGMLQLGRRGSFGAYAPRADDLLERGGDLEVEHRTMRSA